MQNVTATIRNGRVELTAPVDWPNGTQVEVRPLRPANVETCDVRPPMTQWPGGFFDRLRQDWGDEQFERPPQGEFEVREEWLPDTNVWIQVLKQPGGTLEQKLLSHPPDQIILCS